MTISFTQTRLDKNKKGILKPDELGYYRVPAGALNCYNSRGDFYRSTKEVLATFGEGSPFNRKIKDGYLRSERDHPDPSKYFSHLDTLPMTQITREMIDRAKANYIMRLRKHDDSRECGVIRRVDFIPNTELNIKSMTPESLIAIIEIKPSGVMGDLLKTSLDNPHENTAFSVRSITDDELKSNIVYKNIVEPITFDWVPEPGIRVANKWEAPSLESINLQVLYDCYELLNSNSGLESDYVNKLVLDKLINKSQEQRTKRKPFYHQF